MRRFFGTDGIRGVANQPPLTPEIMSRLGQAMGAQFIRGEYRHRVLIGKDPRLSGYMIESALAAGFVSVGMDVLVVGPLPTPAVAMLTRSMRADLGVMISASHNPHSDNGVKVFGPDGCKLSDDVELEIERLMDAGVPLVTPEHMGRMTRIDDAGGRYNEFLKSTLPRGLTFDGLKIVVDCAHGAAYKIAPLVLSELGAQVIAMGNTPDGYNINKACGATSPQAMCDRVLLEKADLGIAFDGDADRCVMCDETGQLIDGDQILAFLAYHMKQTGRLAKDTVVATVMSNLGFETYLKSQNIKLVRTAVGDRYVAEAMTTSGYVLGGEQSGHVILSDLSTAGDGLLTALTVLSYFKGLGQQASKALRVFEPCPQVLKNFQADTSFLKGSQAQALIERYSSDINAKGGRLLVRPSGTEPLIRVMAEGVNSTETESFVDQVIKDLKAIS